ncbi:MAG: TonB-dependent receptor domain-containing protein [Saprospiraceae bacterium]
MRKILLTLLCLSAGFTLLPGQSGTIAGKIIEEGSGFEVIGGTVLVQETGTGTASDLDGNFQLKLAPGTYTLEFSYVGFATKKITGVKVIAGRVTPLDVLLSDETQQLDLGVTVRASAVRNTVAALLTMQQKAPVVMDGISAAQIAQSGDNDVASAVRRVTGVTVEDGKYIYVRGLGDRYSKTTLNGAEIPGLDPNRNTVQMDLFPTTLIDNVLVYKTFAPSLPGDFAGGYVDITTKDFPEELRLNVSASAGYNTRSSFNSSFLSYPGGSKDWLGYDDGTRALPAFVAQNHQNFPEFAEGINNSEKAQEVAALTHAFSNNWQLTNKKPLPNHSFGISLGNQKSLFGKPLGYIAALTYQRKYTHYNDGKYGIYELTGKVSQSSGLNPQLELSDTKSDEEVLWGTMFSTTWKPAPTHKIGLMAMHNQSGQKTARFLNGHKYRDDPDDIFQTRTWDWQERGLSTLQLSGKHVFSSANNLEINWLSSYSLSSQDNPDLRYFTNRYLPSENRYKLKPSSDNVPTRYYRYMKQYNFDNKLNLTFPFEQWNGLRSEFKMGASYVFRDRTFRETRFNFNNQSLSFTGGNTFDYFAAENLIQAGPEGYLTTNGIYVTNNYNPKNNYDADQSVAAAYAMFELPLTAKLRAIAGVRVEKTAIRLMTFDTSATLEKYPFLDGRGKLLDNTDLLPSLNLNYEFNDAMKLRLAYSKTLARPSFRELAPFTSYAVDGGFLFAGNPELQRTLIDNLDLRWEIFPGSGEMLSVSAFYKNFNNPIERTYNPEAANTELTLRNVNHAFLYGSEIEMRKNLGSIAATLHAFSVGANFSYIISQTDVDSKELALMREDNPGASSTREMFGQAPFMFNALLSFKNLKGTRANVTFNVVGQRITVVTRGATPNYYQKPQPNLRFNISQEVANGLRVKLSASNLLDSAYRETATFKGTVYPILTYKTGRTFSVSLSYDVSH